MKPTRLFILTLAAMIAFAGNSLFCRLPLKQTTIDASPSSASSLAPWRFGSS
jgi:hypothetical protein